MRMDGELEGERDSVEREREIQGARRLHSKLNSIWLKLFLTFTGLTNLVRVGIYVHIRAYVCIRIK